MAESDLTFHFGRIQIIKNEYVDSNITNEYAILDTVVDAEFGVAWLLEDGTWKGEIWYAMQSFPFSAADVKAVAAIAHDHLVSIILKD
jgi:hypothetical protein